VLLDAAGRLCLVEVKKEGNPDTRRVVAQLIDYASSLWQMSVEDFERTVFYPYPRTVRAPTSRCPDYSTSWPRRSVLTRPTTSSVTPNWAMDLEQTLRTGRFRLVLAAPTIPPAVQRNIDYMNDQGMLLYGLEVNYFAGDTECFVPQIVVEPRAAERTRIPTHLPPSQARLICACPRSSAGRGSTHCCRATGSIFRSSSERSRASSRRPAETGSCSETSERTSPAATLTPERTWCIRPVEPTSRNRSCDDPRPTRRSSC
jgi:hypothetical protein